MKDAVEDAENGLVLPSRGIDDDLNSLAHTRSLKVYRLDCGLITPTSIGYAMSWGAAIKSRLILLGLTLALAPTPTDRGAT